MNKMKKSEIENQMENTKNKNSCSDRFCPIHGSFSARGRVFRGKVIRKFEKRVCIEFERTFYVQQYERYAKRKTKLHARLPECLADSINIGDYIEIRECRPISKIINFVVIKKISGEEK
jgi:small subunit ribosomal protein S17